MADDYYQMLFGFTDPGDPGRAPGEVPEGQVPSVPAPEPTPSPSVGPTTPPPVSPANPSGGTAPPEAGGAGTGPAAPLPSSPGGRTPFDDLLDAVGATTDALNEANDAVTGFSDALEGGAVPAPGGRRPRTGGGPDELKSEAQKEAEALEKKIEALLKKTRDARIGDLFNDRLQEIFASQNPPIEPDNSKEEFLKRIGGFTRRFGGKTGRLAGDALDFLAKQSREERTKADSREFRSVVGAPNEEIDAILKEKGFRSPTGTPLGSLPLGGAAKAAAGAGASAAATAAGGGAGGAAGGGGGAAAAAAGGGGLGAAGAGLVSALTGPIGLTVIGLTVAAGAATLVGAAFVGLGMASRKLTDSFVEATGGFSAAVNVQQALNQLRTTQAEMRFANRTGSLLAGDLRDSQELTEALFEFQAAIAPLVSVVTGALKDTATGILNAVTAILDWIPGYNGDEITHKTLDELLEETRRINQENLWNLAKSEGDSVDAFTALLYGNVSADRRARVDRLAPKIGDRRTTIPARRPPRPPRP